MVSLAENTKRPVWVASGAMTSGVRTFTAPVLHKWNWRSLSSSVDMMTFGPEYMDYRRAVVMNSVIDNIKRLDRVWLDLTPSDTTDVLAKDADFYVVSAVKGAGSYGEITCKRLSADA